MVGIEGLDPYFGRCADEGLPGEGGRGHVRDRSNGHIVKKDMQTPAAVGRVLRICDRVGIWRIGHGHTTAQRQTQENHNNDTAPEGLEHEPSPLTLANPIAWSDARKY
jgi:hypothetical protein